MNLNQIKLQQQKILASFSELKTDKAILYWPSEDEISLGLDVYVLDENGDYSVAPDGEYLDEAENTIVVKDGKVESITPKIEESNEEPVKAEEVDSPDGGEEPVPDAVEELRKEVNELYSIIDALVKKVQELETRTDEKFEKISKLSAAEPAEDEIETVNSANDKFAAVLENIRAARL